MAFVKLHLIGMRDVAPTLAGHARAVGQDGALRRVVTLEGHRSALAALDAQLFLGCAFATPVVERFGSASAQCQGQNSNTNHGYLRV